jgi:hypothetical protein
MTPPVIALFATIAVATFVGALFAAMDRWPRFNLLITGISGVGVAALWWLFATIANAKDGRFTMTDALYVGLGLVLPAALGWVVGKVIKKRRMDDDFDILDHNSDVDL